MRSVLVFLFFLNLLSPLAGLAQSTNPKEEATKAFNQAEAHFRKGDYEGALAGYQKAYELSKEPLLLFNIGQCYSNLGRYPEAIDSYQRFVTDAPLSPQRPLAESLIKENQAKLPKEQPASSTSSSSPATQPAQDKLALPPAKIFYLGAASSGGIGLVLGAVSFSSALRARGIQKDPNGDNTQIEAPFQRAKTLSHVADIFFILALASGGVGYWSDQQAKTEKISASLSPGGATLSISF